MPCDAWRQYAIIHSDNGLWPVQCQAIILISAGMLLIGLLATNFSEILMKIQQISYKKMFDNIICKKGNHIQASMCLQFSDLPQI